MKPCRPIGERRLWAKSLLLFSVMCAAWSTAVTGPPAHAAPAASGIDAQQIDAFMEGAIQKLNIPGAAVGIVKRDQVVYLKGYGVTGLDGTQVTPQTPFFLGSTTKSFTAMAVMQLIEQGKIEVDAPVQRYLPEFRTADEQASPKITIKHLLNQTSGFSTYEGRVTMTQGEKTSRQYVDDLKETPLAKPVGAVYQYSNVNYDVLGAVIEAVSGQTYSQYITEHIFKPLGMSGSYAGTDGSGMPGLADGHQTLLGLSLTTPQLAHNGNISSGYLISSAEDMTHYLIAQVNQGQFNNRSLVSQQGIAQMHHPDAPISSDSFYGMGWTIKDNTVFHNGTTRNSYSFLMLDGEYGVVILVNAFDQLVSYDGIATGIRDLLRGKTATPADLPSFTKIYALIDTALVIVLLLLARSVYHLFTWRKWINAKPRSMTAQFWFLVIFNLALPLAIFFGFPKLLKANWTVITVFMPGVGHAIFIVAVLLILIGLVKTLFIVQNRGHVRTAVR